jgi:hypothetical protein
MTGSGSGAVFVVEEGGEEHEDGVLLTKFCFVTVCG